MKNNTLKNYEIHQKLGSGSYGVIYKAINKSDKSVCVLKQINLTRMNQKAKKNAINEATIMGKLKHPFIVCYFESFIEERNLNILMEYCDGGDLSIYLKQQNKKFLKQDKIWKFFIEICMGLEHIHKNKILHRDIKSLNIFLNKNGTVKIGDLGVAKMLAHNDFAQTMVGTPYYLSPELCQEKPYNEKSDIWALGCLLYQLCTFKHPFEATNQASLILKIIRGKFSPIPQFYSKQLKEMIDWCLQRDYKRRPTANHILSKPFVRKYIEDLKLEKVVADFNAEVVQKAKITEKTIQPKQAKEKQKTNSQKNVGLQPPKFVKPEPSKRSKVLDDPSQQNQPQLPPPRKAEVVQPNVPKQNIRRKSQKKINSDQESKVLFGNVMPENKQEFISQLEAKLEKAKPSNIPKQQKKQPIYFEIPFKDRPQSSFVEKKSNVTPPQIPTDKIIVHNKALLDQPEPPRQNIEDVYKVKMEKKVAPKVYDQIKIMDKPKPIIKSGGFNKEDGAQMNKKIEVGVANRKKSEIQQKSSDRLNIEKVNPPKNTSHSMRNARKQSQQRHSYLNMRRDSNGGMPVHYPPRVKKPPTVVSNQILKPPVVPTKSSSTSRYKQVTKEEEELVANLPDIITRRASISSDEQQRGNVQNNFKLNEIDNAMILKKYQEIIETAQTQRTNTEMKCSQQQEDIENAATQKVISSSQSSNIHEQQQKIQQEVFVAEKDSFDDEEVEEHVQKDEGENEEQFEEQNVFQVNKFEMKNDDQKQQSEWSFDAEPELPMLQEYETPYFEQANMYLVEQKQKTEEEALEDKKKHLQLKLKENMKREDQINQLMQLKIEQCKSAVSSGFEQILTFFRSKINMDREYTDEDERQVETFLSSKNLIDHRKFQNIYKIMHFEMELENTRRIIQTICKKLNELQGN